MGGLWNGMMVPYIMIPKTNHKGTKKSVKNGNENSLFTDASKQAPQQKAFK
jgi:hypothetical protein